MDNQEFLTWFLKKLAHYKIKIVGTKVLWWEGLGEEYHQESQMCLTFEDALNYAMEVYSVQLESQTYHKYMVENSQYPFIERPPLPIKE